MSDAVKVDWIFKSGKQCLRFRFGKNLDGVAAAVAIEKWKEAFRIKLDPKITVIWDCTQMKGYDRPARVQWTAALRELKPRIDSIWLISTSSIIKMGASLMGLVTSIDIKTVPDEADIIIGV